MQKADIRKQWEGAAPGWVKWEATVATWIEPATTAMLAMAPMSTSVLGCLTRQWRGEPNVERGTRSGGTWARCRQRHL